MLAQQLRWAFGDFNGADAQWMGPDKQMVQATDEQRLVVRATLAETDVLILTLGLSEVWYDASPVEPFWRAIPRHLFNPDRDACRVLTVAETVASLEEIEAIRATHLPDMKLLFTVSPIRASSYLSANIGANREFGVQGSDPRGTDEFLRTHADSVGQTLFYFPAYEIVTEVFRDPFRDDNRDVHSTAIAQVLDLFARTYTSLAADSEPRAMTNEHLADSQLMCQVEALGAESSSCSGCATSARRSLMN